MGLPMFREPDEITPEQTIAKLDQIAANRRSTIRRESTVRPGRPTSSRSLIERIRDSRREAANSISNITSRSHRDGIRAIHEMDAEFDRRRQRQRARVNNLERELSRRPDSDHPRSLPPTVEELINRVGNVDVLENFDFDRFLGERPSDATETVSQHLPRPARESGLRFEMDATSHSESERNRLSQVDIPEDTRLPSPPYTRQSHWSHPAIASHSDDLDFENTYGLAPVSRRLERIPVDGPILTPPPESAEAPYLPLHRVNHASPRPQSGSASRLDGLGDRMRSPSPANDDPFEENWTNLMDPGRSSTATSFLSSRSDSRSGSNRSSQATTMTTSFGEITPDDSCDLDLPSGITEDHVRAIRALHGRGPRQPTARSLIPDDLPHVPSQRERLRGLGSSPLDLELFRIFQEREQRNEPVPAELWSAIGLSPEDLRDIL